MKLLLQRVPSSPSFESEGKVFSRRLGVLFHGVLGESKNGVFRGFGVSFRLLLDYNVSSWALVAKSFCNC